MDSHWQLPQGLLNSRMLLLMRAERRRGQVTRTSPVVTIAEI